MAKIHDVAVTVGSFRKDSMRAYADWIAASHTMVVTDLWGNPRGRSTTIRVLWAKPRP